MGRGSNANVPLTAIAIWNAECCERTGHDTLIRPCAASNAETPNRLALSLALAVACALSSGSPAFADRIENTVAVFSALDKVTARISKFEVALGETKTFGALKVTPRACYSRPPTELPKTTTFVEVNEMQLDGKEKRIFTGWMFAESPGLYGVEHPTFDVWLTECQKPLKATAQTAPAAPAADGKPAPAGAAPAAAATDAPADAPRRRVRR